MRSVIQLTEAAECEQKEAARVSTSAFNRTVKLNLSEPNRDPPPSTPLGDRIFWWVPGKTVCSGCAEDSRSEHNATIVAATPATNHQELLHFDPDPADAATAWTGYSAGSRAALLLVQRYGNLGRQTVHLRSGQRGRTKHCDLQPQVLHHFEAGVAGSTWAAEHVPARLRGNPAVS